MESSLLTFSLIFDTIGIVILKTVAEFNRESQFSAHKMREKRPKRRKINAKSETIVVIFTTFSQKSLNHATEEISLGVFKGNETLTTC